MSKISGKSPEELYYFGKLIDKLVAYYDNQMQANEGNYTTAFQKEEYTKAKAKRDLYTAIKGDVIEAMENTVLSIANPALMTLYKSKIEKLNNDEETVAKR